MYSLQKELRYKKFIWDSQVKILRFHILKWIFFAVRFTISVVVILTVRHDQQKRKINNIADLKFITWYFDFPLRHCQAAVHRLK